MAADDLPDLASLRPVLQSLVERKLVIELSPEGRGQIVTHGLYQEGELDKVRRTVNAIEARSETPIVPSVRAETAAPDTSSQGASQSDGVVQQLRQEVGELRAEVERLRDEAYDSWHPGRP